MKNAYIIATGTELLLGKTVDSNSVFLASKLMEMDIKVIGKSTVADDREQLEQAFSVGNKSADVIISTGGLGPTFDDLTKIVACESMGCELELRPEEERRVREYFAGRNRPMPEINLRQAMFPRDSIVLKNSLGTAPGMYLRKNGRILILLPGPPREMINMYLEEVEPLLKIDFGENNPAVLNKTIKIWGLGESQVEERLDELMDCPDGCSIALLADDGEINIRLLMEAENNSLARAVMNDLVDQMAAKMGRNVFGYDEEILVGKVASLLKQRGNSLAVAESCTGGLLGKLITDLAGSSQYFWGGVIAYSNACKQLYLGVKEDTLLRYGAVSPETAQEMAEGLLHRAHTDFTLAVTGVAGPEGGSPEKPVGLVYIALAYPGGCQVRELRYNSDRELVRILAAKSALDLLRRHLVYNL